MEKYKTACIEYARARAAVGTASKKIGDALAACADDQYDKLDPDCWHLSNPVEHLKMAYALSNDENGVYHANHDGDPAEYLAGVCQHCLSAHHAVQERKQARQRYGAAKRRVAFLGDRCLKDLQEE